MPQLILELTDKELAHIEAGLRRIFGIIGEKKTAAQLAKVALKSYVRSAKAMLRAKEKGTGPVKTDLTEKLYLTSRGNFIPLKEMDTNHCYNSVKKMERLWRGMKDDQNQPYKDADAAFPSLPGYAGYVDLIALLKLRNEEASK